MLNKIFIGTILMLFVDNVLFAQQNTVNTNTIQNNIYIPGLTKEEKAEKMHQESMKQAEMKKNEISPVENIDVKTNEDIPLIEKNASLINKSEINPSKMEESLLNIQLLKAESKEAVINRSEIQKVIEIEKPDKK